jgi:hypothetical protein
VVCHRVQRRVRRVAPGPARDARALAYAPARQRARCERCSPRSCQNGSRISGCRSSAWRRASSARPSTDSPRAGSSMFVSGVYRTVVRLAHVEVELDDSTAGQAALTDGRRPVVVLCRHAGEGDTLLVLHQLLYRYRRRPRVVMHKALRPGRARSGAASRARGCSASRRVRGVTNDATRPVAEPFVGAPVHARRRPGVTFVELSATGAGVVLRSSLTRLRNPRQDWGFGPWRWHPKGWPGAQSSAQTRHSLISPRSGKARGHAGLSDGETRTRTGGTTIFSRALLPAKFGRFAGDSSTSRGRDRSQAFPDFASVLRALRPTSALIGLFVAGASTLAIGECKGMRTSPRTDRVPRDDHVEEAEPPPCPKLESLGRGREHVVRERRRRRGTRVVVPAVAGSQTASCRCRPVEALDRDARLGLPERTACEGMAVSTSTLRTSVPRAA